MYLLPREKVLKVPWKFEKVENILFLLYVKIEEELFRQDNLTSLYFSVKLALLFYLQVSDA